MIRKQADFPFLDEYKKQFAITKDTIFACYPDIYCDGQLTQDLLIHELVHLRQQEKIGLKEWVYDFLYDPKKRLEYEVEAYKEQLKSIKDRNHKTREYFKAAQQLSSDLYGNIIDYQTALQLLKPW